ncbi:MAG: DUF3383 family protein, partial [Myxococcota bacterium]
ITSNEKANLESRSANPFIQLTSTISVSQGGAVASGQFIDVIHTVDFLVAQVQVALVNAMLTNDKVPFDDLGIGQLEAVMLGKLAEFQGPNLAIDPSVEIKTSAPEALDVPVQDRATRTLNNLSASFRLSGAIHSANVELEFQI